MPRPPFWQACLHTSGQQTAAPGQFLTGVQGDGCISVCANPCRDPLAQTPHAARAGTPWQCQSTRAAHRPPAQSNVFAPLLEAGLGGAALPARLHCSISSGTFRGACVNTVPKINHLGLAFVLQSWRLNFRFPTQE